MAIASRFRQKFTRRDTEDATTPLEIPMQSSDEKHAAGGNVSPAGPNTLETAPEKDLLPTEDAQTGVKDIEAITLVWTKPMLIGVFAS